MHARQWESEGLDLVFSLDRGEGFEAGVDMLAHRLLGGIAVPGENGLQDALMVFVGRSTS